MDDYTRGVKDGETEASLKGIARSLDLLRENVSEYHTANDTRIDKIHWYLITLGGGVAIQLLILVLKWGN
jgi:hypothetical protein